MRTKKRFLLFFRSTEGYWHFVRDFYSEYASNEFIKHPSMSMMTYQVRKI